MIGICRAVTGAEISSTRRYLGETGATDYSPLQVAEKYEIYGFMLVCDRVDFLVAPPAQLPFWVPSDLFDLVDSSLPAGWGVCVTSLSSDYCVLERQFKIGCIVGYPSLVNDYQHYLGLIERDPQAIKTFLEEAHG